MPGLILGGRGHSGRRCDFEKSLAKTKELHPHFRGRNACFECLRLSRFILGAVKREKRLVVVVVRVCRAGCEAQGRRSLGGPRHPSGAVEDRTRRNLGYDCWPVLSVSLSSGRCNDEVDGEYMGADIYMSRMLLTRFLCKGRYLTLHFFFFLAVLLVRSGLWKGRAIALGSLV